MWGRITLTRSNLESVTSELNVSPEGCRGYPLLELHYNIAPTSVHPILTLNDHGQRQIEPMTWGSIPKIGKGLMINWRSESFPPRAPRCAVITDGFYEWTGPKKRTSALLVSSVRSRTGADGRSLGVADRARLGRNASLCHFDHPGQCLDGPDSLIECP